jgi:hypothetical protein
VRPEVLNVGMPTLGNLAGLAPGSDQATGAGAE